MTMEDPVDSPDKLSLAARDGDGSTATEESRIKTTLS